MDYTSSSRSFGVECISAKMSTETKITLHVYRQIFDCLQSVIFIINIRAQHITFNKAIKTVKIF